MWKSYTPQKYWRKQQKCVYKNYSLSISRTIQQPRRSLSSRLVVIAVRGSEPKKAFSKDSIEYAWKNIWRFWTDNNSFTTNSTNFIGFFKCIPNDFSRTANRWDKNILLPNSNEMWQVFLMVKNWVLPDVKEDAVPMRWSKAHQSIAW